ncbi:hypothetical protein DYB28_012319 [Aphanomyces astaci]|uniref:TFIIS central domain-containing protein n=1 Tax=Aphanomyces astaci TaxID=112090 RepID=A0A9X8HEM1_APHAT|nr:hypothetical protein DYB28_012319 [Aphanomyces astaci]
MADDLTGLAIPRSSTAMEPSMKRGADSMHVDHEIKFASDDDDDDNWVNEMERELDLQVEKKPKTARVAIDFPHDVLLTLFTFVTVSGRHDDVVARRKVEKSLEHVFQLYASDDDAAGTCRWLAIAIESQLHAHHNVKYSLTKRYREQARMLLFNLRDCKNDMLRLRVLRGDVSPSALARLTSKDMANPHLVEQRKEWIKDRTAQVTRHVRHLQGMLETDMFTCPSCGSNKTQHCQGRRKARADRVCIVVMCSRCPHRWQV